MVPALPPTNRVAYDNSLETGPRFPNVLNAFLVQNYGICQAGLSYAAMAETSTISVAQRTVRLLARSVSGTS